MKRSQDIDEIVDLALELMMDRKEKKQLKTDDLLQIMIDNIYGVVEG